MSDTPPETPPSVPEEPSEAPAEMAPPTPAAEMPPPAPPAETPPPAYSEVPPAQSAEPPMGMPPVMAPPAKGGSGLRMVIIGVVLVAVILVAVIGYAVIGYAAGESKVSAATKSLNSVTLDQNKLSATVQEIDTKVSKFSASSNFDANQYKSLVSEFLADSQAGVTTVDADTATIAAADPKLDENSWLTVIDKSNIDKMHSRFGHATKGLVAIRVVLAGYVEDGKFYVALGDALIDFEKLGTLTGSNDFTTVVATITGLKAHVATALQLSTATGLPPEVHAFMVDFQSLADDFNNLVNAAVAGDDAGVTNYLNKIDAETTKIGAYNFDKMDTDRDAYYKPYIDTFNAEFAAATG